MDEKRKIDLEQFLGKYVEIKVYRRRKVKKFYGKLTHVNPSEVCLLSKNNVARWINRPSRFRDTIEEVAER